MARDDAGIARGDTNEKRVLALLLAHKPAWVHTARQTAHGSPADQAGIDVLLETDRGELGLQVKSTGEAATKFRRDARKHGVLDRIGVVVAGRRNRGPGAQEVTDQLLLTRIQTELERIRGAPATAAELRADDHARRISAQPFAGLWPT